MVEIAVAMSVFMVALALILPTYSALSRSASNSQSITTADSAILPALSTLGADVSNAGPTVTTSSGTTIYAMYIPTSSPPPAPTSGQSVVLATAAESGAVQCVQWEVTSGGALMRRTWSPSNSPSQTSFVAVPGTSDLIVSAPSSGASFKLGGANEQVLSVDFKVQAGRGSPTREIKTAFAAQGTAQSVLSAGSPPYSAPNNTCSVTPSPSS